MSISFISAYRLLLSFVLPTGTHGNSVFELSVDQETEHNMSMFCMFWISGAIYHIDGLPQL